MTLLHKLVAGLLSKHRSGHNAAALTLLSVCYGSSSMQIHLLVASLSCCARVFIASNPSSGVGASPRALTKALPTMTPSAPHETTCCAYTCHCDYFQQSKLALAVNINKEAGVINRCKEVHQIHSMCKLGRQRDCNEKT